MGNRKTDARGCVRFFVEIIRLYGPYGPRCGTDGLRGAISFAVRFLPTALLFQRPSGTPSFAARRKIEEKGVPRGLRPPLDPRGNVLGHSDVLCANHFATVRVTRLRRLRRSAYPLASAYCGCPARTKDLRNHPTSDYKSGWLFFKFQQFLCITCSTIESVDAVQNGGPAKAQRSGFGEERRSNGMTELLPRKAKRRIWSLRRRDGPKSR